MNRIFAVGLGVFALVAEAASRHSCVNGAAGGVLLVVVAQVVIDRYSEARAIRYAGQLRVALAERTAR